MFLLLLISAVAASALPKTAAPAKAVRPAARFGAAVSAAKGGALLPSVLDAGYDLRRTPSGSVAVPVRAAPSAAVAAPLAPAAADSPRPKSEPPAPSALKAAVPGMITGLNLVSGFGALVAASAGAFPLAAGLIVLAALFDGLDGRAARALGVSSPLGVQLDSLADVVSFGAAPAFLLYASSLSALGPAGFAVAAAFTAAGAYRLARFNVGAAAPAKAGSDRFTGVPIPMGAGMALAALSAPPAFAAGAVLLAAAAMVSRIPYPAFKKGGLEALRLPALFAVAAAAPLAALGLASLIPAALAGMYLLSGPLLALYEGGSPVWKKELKRKAFHQLSLGYLAAYFLLGPDVAFWAMAGWTALIAVLETARLKTDWGSSFADENFGDLLREKEAGRYSGTLYAALGLLGVFGFFGASPALVTAGVLALVIGDAASPLVGMRFGWRPYTIAGTKRSLDGTLAGFAVALAIGLGLGFPPLAVLGAALVFTAVDAYPVKPDDNLWIPLAFTAALSILS